MKQNGDGKPQGTYQVPAVDKALDVLELLASRPDGAAMTDLANALGRSMGEIYRTVITLERRAFLYKHPVSERYHLSLKLFELAHRHPPMARLLNMAQPLLEDLALATLQSCHLAVAERDELLIVAAANSPLPMHYSVKVGAKFPLLETSSGVVITAFQSKARMEATLAVIEKGEHAGLRRRFADALRLGHEAWESRVVTGVTNLTVPVSDHSGRVIAAITVPYLEQTRASQTRESTLLALKETGRALSRGLGAQDTQTVTSEPRETIAS
ncbi:MAG: IclR family transcriptional regulator [Pseudomonadota bacterium]